MEISKTLNNFSKNASKVKKDKISAAFFTGVSVGENPFILAKCYFLLG
jgi:hypothetical protein